MKSQQTSQGTVVKTVLPNGLRVISEEMSHVRSVAVGVWVDVGSRTEKAGESGISHFVEHMVFKGTANRTADEIACSIDSIGGHLDAFTTKENVAFTAKVLDEHFGRKGHVFLGDKDGLDGFAVRELEEIAHGCIKRSESLCDLGQTRGELSR